MEEALGFEQKPELDTVGRQAVVVLGRVLAGVGVQPGASVLLDDARVGVWLDVGLGFGDGGLDPVPERLELLGAGWRALGLLGLELVPGALYGFKRLGLLGGVVGADPVGSLERHVLEHMRQAGLARRIVHRSSVHVSVEGYHRGFVTLQDDEPQPVGKREFGDALLELGEVLGGK